MGFGAGLASGMQNIGTNAASVFLEGLKNQRDLDQRSEDFKRADDREARTYNRQLEAEKRDLAARREDAATSRKHEDNKAELSLAMKTPNAEVTVRRIAQTMGLDIDSTLSAYVNIQKIQADENISKKVKEQRATAIFNAQMETHDTDKLEKSFARAVRDRDYHQIGVLAEKLGDDPRKAIAASRRADNEHDKDQGYKDMEQSWLQFSREKAHLLSGPALKDQIDAIGQLEAQIKTLEEDKKSEEGAWTGSNEEKILDYEMQIRRIRSGMMDQAVKYQRWQFEGYRPTSGSLPSESGEASDGTPQFGPSDLLMPEEDFSLEGILDEARKLGGPVDESKRAQTPAVADLLARTTGGASRSSAAPGAGGGMAGSLGPAEGIQSRLGLPGWRQPDAPDRFWGQQAGEGPDIGHHAVDAIRAMLNPKNIQRPLYGDTPPVGAPEGWLDPTPGQGTFFQDVGATGATEATQEQLVNAAKAIQQLLTQNKRRQTTQ